MRLTETGRDILRGIWLIGLVVSLFGGVAGWIAILLHDRDTTWEFATICTVWAISSILTAVVFDD